MNETLLITLYCFVDAFINTITNYPIGTMILEHGEGKREPKKRLTLI